MKHLRKVWGTLLVGAFAFATMTTTVQAEVVLRIRGTPATQASVGQAYAFQPQATDADGSQLRFIVRNKPARQVRERDVNA